MAAKEFDARKFAGAVAAIVLHVAIVAALLQATVGRTPPVQPSKELIAWLSLPSKPQPHEAPAVPQPRATAPFRIIPDGRAITLQPAANGTDLKGLHNFDCTAQNLADLPPEQRAQCKGVLGPRPEDDSVDFADHTGRSHDAARWARGRDRKNGPLLLPCASPTAAGIGIGTLICLGNGLANGFDLDAQPGYADKPVETHVPNNGDPPDAPH
jgi:hypothetical protein